MSDYRSNKTNAEIDAILDSATPKGTAGDAPDTLSLQGARTYSEVLSKSSLICAGEIIAPHTILGSITIGAEVEVTDAFRLKFGENNPAVTKVVLVDKRVVVGEEDNMDTRYIYSGDYEGCYFVMGNFDGNDTIFGLDAIEGDWVIAQNKRWAKIVTKQREISDLDAIRRGAGKGDTSVQGVDVNNRLLTPDYRGYISLPTIPTKNDIANMGFTQNKGTVTGVMVNGESKSPNSDGIVDLGTIEGGGGIAVETDPVFSASPAAGITEAKKNEWDNKVDKVEGKGLSSEDFTSAEKQKLASLENYDDADLREDLEILQNNVGNVTDLVNDFNADISNLYNTKQDVLVSGETLKTINGESLLGSGDITISGGGGGEGSALTEDDIANMGFTKNVGTVTSVAGISPIDGNVPVSNMHREILSSITTNLRGPAVSGALTSGKIEIVNVPVTSFSINGFTSLPNRMVEEYTVHFVTSADGCEFSLPSSVKWAGEKPGEMLPPNTYYELNIVKTIISGTSYFKAVLTPFV